jgi:hypothetical protein
MGKQLLTYTSKDKMVAGIPLGREGREADMAGAALYLRYGVTMTSFIGAVNGFPLKPTDNQIVLFCLFFFLGGGGS